MMDAHALLPFWSVGGEGYFGYRLILAAKVFDRAMLHELGAWFSLTLPQFRVVSQLGLFGVGTVRSLAEGAFVDRAEVSRATRELLKQRLIRRLPNPDDPRSSLFSLTATGRRSYQRCRKPACDLISKVLKGVPKRDLDAANRVFWKVFQSSLLIATSSPEKPR